METAPRYSSHAVSAEDGRFRKAEKIAAILQSETRLANCRVLDVGTGSGHIAHHIAKHAKSVTSVNISDERVVSEGYDFVEVKDHLLPFDDESFDVVISNQVIEHMTCQREHIEEICRVLKPSGVFYLAMPNKFSVLEPHYKLPFLSWLPRPLAEVVTMKVRGKPWDVYPLSCYEAARMTRGHFIVQDKTIDVLRNPETYKLDVAPHVHFATRAVPACLYRMLYGLIPAYIWILRKPRTASMGTPASDKGTVS